MRALVVMGVSGSGKSTVAQALCSRSGATMIEGDQFHPARNVQKMQAGIPLNDEDRQGWLELLVKAANERLATTQHVVVACSALKRSYRETLQQGIPYIGFVFLALSEAEATQRVTHRPGHFMPASLVRSQFDDLEPPHDEANVLTLSATQPVTDIVDEVMAWWPRTLDTGS
ncbi:gluconokinase [Dyella mobilis]|uniref:Gluconokinase n=1 Tax=Dyella mobilis TaxID=1849582 RepID=A0ABS2KMK0_9GAMM|nr:gluconokinase [Dyella mobilis]MBM7132382.1 gluconokinase [Dyella mobilis]